MKPRPRVYRMPEFNLEYARKLASDYGDACEAPRSRDQFIDVGMQCGRGFRQIERLLSRSDAVLNRAIIYGFLCGVVTASLFFGLLNLSLP